MDTEQLIQDYIAHRLSDDDQAKVVRLLETDAEFKAEFQSYKDMSVAFKISEAQSLKKHFQQLDTQENPHKKSNFNRYLYLAIASIIVFGLFYNLLSTPSGDQLFNSYFDHAQNTYQPITRTSGNNIKNVAFVAYENGNFKTAENEFKTLLQTSKNPSIRFYYASSLLNQAKYELALEQFKILNQIDFDYTNESLWYTALIYVKHEDYENAKAQLNTLNTRASTFKAKDRKALLKYLED
ncbi:tetratricopeptide repeat protein [Psychroserpens damuponensis]|uniref:tetratricopeptide repeat protein n=1 Tax=Psychroserpens damuponensis TaxID=943936 RepID=UPI00058FCDBF|nr:hypothetical protein [Psychroserpens damuponensis]